MSAIHKDQDIPYIGATTYMPTEEEEIYRHASWLGVVAGLRSMMPAALLASSSEEASPTVKTITSLLAVGEIIADKLPFTPNRLQTGPFVGRLVAGAVSGTLLCRRYHQPAIQGAVRGAIGAAIGAAAGNLYRTLAAQGTDVPDIIWALAEDAIALGLGNKAIQKPSTETHSHK